MFTSLFSRQRLILLAGFLLAITFSKGVTFDWRAYSEPYVYLSYGDGLIKRGLFGEMLSWFLEGASRDRLRMASLEIHFLLTLALGMLIFALARRASAHTENNALWQVMLVFAASQFWTNLASTPGFLDVHLYVLFCLVLMAYFAGYYWAAAAVSLIAPFMHESAIFVWSPLVVFLAWESYRQRAVQWRRCLPIVALLIGTVLILSLHSQAAAVLQVNASPLPPLVKQDMIEIQMGQTLGLTLKNMASLWSRFPINGITVMVLMGLPSLFMLAAYAAMRRITRMEMLVLAVATFAPLCILLVAWDISRFVVFTNFAAIISIILWEYHYRPEPRRAPKVAYALAGLTACLFMLPCLYLYFDLALIYDDGVVAFGTNPIGQMAHRFFEQYNAHPH